jgi:hypothetical protein
VLVIAAFIFALVVAFIFSSGKSYNRSFSTVLTFFLILFLAGIAGGVWIVPFGPVMLGVAWMPVLFIIVIFAFLFSIPPPYLEKSKTAYITSEDKDTRVSEEAKTLSIFVWLILAFLVIAIFIGYMKSST